MVVPGIMILSLRQSHSPTPLPPQMLTFPRRSTLTCKDGSQKSWTLLSTTQVTWKCPFTSPSLLPCLWLTNVWVVSSIRGSGWGFHYSAVISPLFFWEDMYTQGARTKEEPGNGFVESSSTEGRAALVEATGPSNTSHSRP